MITTKEAVQQLVKDLEADEDYRMGWQANIAMAFVDEMAKASYPSDMQTVHKVANLAAERFLKLLCYQGKDDK